MPPLLLLLLLVAVMDQGQWSAWRQDPRRAVIGWWGCLATQSPSLAVACFHVHQTPAACASRPLYRFPSSFLVLCFALFFLCLQKSLLPWSAFARHHPSLFPRLLFTSTPCRAPNKISSSTMMKKRPALFASKNLIFQTEAFARVPVVIRYALCANSPV